MDITRYFVSLREAALLYGDYATYRTQLSGKLLNTRKKLAIVTKNRGKFHQKPEITPEKIAENNEWVHLQLLTSERAWAHAMTMKSSHSADTKGITGKVRSHIVSRLDKGAKVAEKLAEAVSQSSTSGASDIDVLEARAYAALLRGAALFERQSWEASLKSYSTARIIYSALSTSAKGDIFKDLLSDTIDPSIRFAAYQLKIPRTQPVPSIALNTFPKSDAALVERVDRLGTSVLESGDSDAMQGLIGPGGAPTTLTWRTREVKIEDAAISVAWAAVQKARAALSDRLAASADGPLKERAAAYDDILIAAQDAADATKQAIDELKAEGVPQSDPRMQSLQITRTAVNYEMISWRIGRNRALMGDKDGAVMDAAAISSSRRKAKNDSTPASRKEEAPGRQIARLREKVVLYDGTLQSIESIKELPGVAADQELSAQLDATLKYFNSLKSLAIARSHSFTGAVANSLALVKYGYDRCEEALPVLSTSKPATPSSPRNITVTEDEAKNLHEILRGELQRFRALVEISNLRKSTNVSGSTDTSIPLVGRLNHYPSEGVDLDNIVVYPPRAEPIPVKPIFLDVAWNYINYPNEYLNREQTSKASDITAKNNEDNQPKKRGWFGFGR